MSFITLLEKYNILLMCETWTTEISNVDIEGFHMFAAHRKQQKSTARRISVGVIMYIDNDILRGTSQLHGSTDEAVWVKFDKGFFNVQNDMILCVCYIPPTNSSSQSHKENDAFDSLILDMAKFKDMYRDAIFLVCGDMNGRTGNAPDHLVNDNSSYLPLPDNYVEDIELWRVNEDHIINTQGRNILEMCKMCDLCILNGRCGADKGDLPVPHTMATV